MSSLGTGTATKIYELKQDSLKVNAWYGIKHDCVIEHFFVAETIISVNIYLNMLQLSFNNLMALKKKRGNYVSTRLHFSYKVQNALKVRFSNQWIGRGRPTTPWSPQSPDLPSLDSFPMDFY